MEILGSNNVYHQPPESIKIEYPCIVYKRDRIDTEYAGNRPYKHMKRYQIQVIDVDPDDVIHEKIGQLPMSSYDRFFVADGLNHDVYNVYF